MATRKEMEDAIRKIDEEFGADAEDLEGLDLIDIKDIFNEYMSKYASKKTDGKIKKVKDGGEIVKVEKKNRGGLMRKPKLAKRGF